MEKLKEWLKLFHKGNNKLLSNILFIIGIGILFIFLGNTAFDNIPYSTKDEQINNSNIGNNNVIVEDTTKSFEEEMEERVKRILSKMEGVGTVEVMITTSYGKEVFIAEDNNSTYSLTKEEDNEGGQRVIQNEDVQTKIVMKSQESGSTEPVILKEKQPEVKGVLILAEGGEDPRIKQKLTTAVQTLLDVPAHKVQVFKINNK
ncbi:stage III sporulation protein AG [Defluviitalea phaphyphila]|uniref:stage III sporulation protein AG n=1 Tax=Defluviitalea phaphyphila TaxID=1473580 RepID=UPI00072FECA5|nr:stage III sporulation protein AG [Defluviitalea phaphyphila]